MRHKNIWLISVLLIISLLTACGSAQTNGETENSTAGTPAQIESEATANPEETESAEDADSEGTADAESTGSSNILVVYFSLAGEQYDVGVIEEGNTSIIAHIIAEQTGADLFEIEPVTPYPESQSELLAVSQEERSESARPEIANEVENWNDYDTIFIGYPIWWGDMPMIVYNFVESYDFEGKTVIPFCTHGGSGLAGTESTIAEITGVLMLDGFAISGETAQNDRDRSRNEVNEWLNEISFAE